MKKYYFLILVFFTAFSVSSQTPASINWNGYEITYIAQTSFDTGLDGIESNSKLQIKNISNASPNPILFQLYIEGLVSSDPIRDTHGDGGFAVFPNGGALIINQGETAYTQNWLRGVYESRFNNTPPAVNETKSYNFHFLFSESQDALNASGFPKDASLVGDLPVTLQFTNHENSIDVVNGDLTIDIEVTTQDTAPFNLDIGTEANGFNNNFFNTIRIQDGNGSTTPYLFRAKVKNRDDWFVKISKTGKKTEFIHVDPNNPSISVTLSPDTNAISPYNFTLIKSVNTPTGFWRGAVSESEGTFLAIPGQENWGGTANPKTASKIYKYKFDGTLVWDFNFEWEAWGGDMSDDGSIVAVASNQAGNTGTYNPSGGNYLLVINGLTGSVIANIPGLDSKSLKISHDGKYVAIGLQGGNFDIYDITNNQLYTDVGGTTYNGQVREMLWSNDNTSLYVSNGDGYLRKFSLNFSGTISSTETWKSYVGGWAFINGLNMSHNSNYIAVGSKSKDQTVVNTSDGSILWSKHSGNFDSIISKDDTKLVTFGGKVYNLLTGEFLGALNRTATTHFFNNDPFILSVDRSTINGSQVQGGINVHSFQGDFLKNSDGTQSFYNPNDLSFTAGEQVQWSYLTADDSKLIVLSRDMDTANEVGISIFSITNSGSSLAINEESLLSKQIKVYPNPANNQLNLRLNNTTLSNIQSIKIFDLNGRLLKNIKKFKTQLNLNIKDLKQGVYLVKVATTKSNYISKFIKN